MTMMTPIDGVTAPLRAGDLGIRVLSSETREERHARVAAEDQAEAIAAAEPFVRQAAKEGQVFTPSRRHDGWTPDRQRAFLAYLADGLTVGDAATLVGLSATSAYAFRNRAAGAAFNIGWSAALLLQRNRLVDELTSRAFRGQTETITHDNGTRSERHRYDNGLALRLLARLDKVAAADLPDRTGDARATRLAAQEWDRYLDLIADDAGPARAGMFLALRVTEGESAALAPIAALGRADVYARARAGVAAEVDVSDLDPAARARWTAEQWTRAEAAGLVALAPEGESSPAEPLSGSQHPQRSRDDDAAFEPDRIWWCDDGCEWRTDYPPPDDFDGDENGDYGGSGYSRSLSDEEQAAIDVEDAAERAADTIERDAAFAVIPEEARVRTAPGAPPAAAIDADPAWPERDPGPAVDAASGDPFDMVDPLFGKDPT